MITTAKNKHMTFRLKDGKWERTKNPTPEQSRSLAEQRARMFTPDGQFRMVVEIRDQAQRAIEAQIAAVVTGRKAHGREPAGT